MFINFFYICTKPHSMPQKAIPLIFCILFFYSFGSKQQDDTDIAHFNTTSQKLVGNGYDLESYFSENKPVKGKSSISSQYQGLLLYFSSQENKDLFINDPTRYLPKYGGWCAYAIGDYAKKLTLIHFLIPSKMGNYIFSINHTLMTRKRSG